MNIHPPVCLKPCLYLLVFSIVLPFSGLVKAGVWKNLCPDSHICKAELNVVSPGSIEGGAEIRYPIHRVFDKEEVLGVQNLLVYPDKVAVSTLMDAVADPDVSKLKKVILQHSSGNWIITAESETFPPAMYVWTLDSSGNLLNKINFRASDTVKESLTVHSLHSPIMQQGDTIYIFTSSIALGNDPGFGLIGMQVFTSTDSGLSWIKHTPFIKDLGTPNPDVNPVFAGNHLREIPFFRARKMMVNPFAEGILFLGHQSGESLKGPLSLYNLTSTVEGLQFEKLGTVGGDDELFDFAIDPASVGSNEPTLFGVTQAGRLFRSQDAGKHWQLVSQVGLAKLPRHEVATGIEVIYPASDSDLKKPLLLVSTSTQVLSSRDEGVSWQSFSFGLPSGRQIIYYVNDQLLVSNETGWYRCETKDCTGAVSPVPQVFTGELQAVEFHNSQLDHYFLTADKQEISGIESGLAGPGWSRTGWDFTVWPPLAHPLRYGKLACRFYGSLWPGPNSHFFTASSDECAYLQGLQQKTQDSKPRWNFEGFAFSVEAVDASTGQCRENRRAVYRAYNNGFARGIDSNHRFVPNQAEIEKMVDQGWVNEGIAFCVGR